MKYLDINKNNNLNISENDYDKLFNFIRNKTKVIATYNGTYESPRSNKALNLNENTIRYYINYYEPKTIFSLINHILLHQKENFNEKYFYPFLNIFKIFWDIITEKRNPGKYIEKLPFSDIISFFRSFDYFLKIYNNKQNTDDILNKNFILEVLNKLIKYLVNEVYPGETIK